MGDRGKGDAAQRFRMSQSIGFKYGFLSKLGKKIRTWRKRWFVLEDSNLVYYSGPSDTEKQGAIPLQGIQSIVHASDDDTSKPFCFKMVANSRSYLFLTESEKELNEWMTAMRAISSLSSNQSVFDRRISRQMENIKHVVTQVFLLLEQSNRIACAHPDNPSHQKLISEACTKVAQSSVSACNFAFMTAAKASAAKGGQLPPLINMSKNMDQLAEAIEALIATTGPLESSSPRPSDASQRLDDILRAFYELVKQFRDPALEDANGHSDVRSSQMGSSTASSTTSSSNLSLHSSERLLKSNDRDTLLSSNVLRRSMVVTMDSMHAGSAADLYQSYSTQSTNPMSMSVTGKPRDLEKVIKSATMSAKETASLAIDMMKVAVESYDESSFLIDCKTTIKTCAELETAFKSCIDFVMMEDMRQLLVDMAESLQPECCKLFHAIKIYRYGDADGKGQSDAGVLRQAGTDFAEVIRVGISIIEATFQQQQMDKTVQDTASFIEQILAEDGNSDESLKKLLTNSRGAVNSLSMIVSTIVFFGSSAENQEEKLLTQVRSLQQHIRGVIAASRVLNGLIQEENILQQYSTASDALSATVLRFYRSLHQLQDGLRRDEILTIYSRLTQDVCQALQEVAVGARSVLESCGKLNDEKDLGANDVNIWDEPPDISGNIVMYAGPNGDSIKAATLNKLVERLLPQQKSDVNYMKTFITTYRSFTTPGMLLKKIKQRYSIPRSKLPSSISLEEYKQNYIQPIQLRVYNVLKYWMEQSFSDFNDKLIESLQDFITVFRMEGPPKLADQLTAILNKNKAGVPERKLTVHDTIAPIADLDPMQVFLKASAEDIAKQLCLIDFRIFGSIKPVELLNQAWNKPKYKHLSPNVLFMVDRFNILSKFVATSIVLTTKLKDRIALCNKFIEIALALLRFNNFNSILSIISGFGNSAVHRLKHTKSGMAKSLLGEMEAMETLMSSKKSFATFREKLHTINPPCVPYLGMYLTDLTFIDDGNPDFLEGLINFRKRDLTYSVISEIQQYQHISYNFAEDAMLKSALMHPHCLEYKEMYEESLKREPRNAEASAIE